MDTLRPEWIERHRERARSIRLGFGSLVPREVLAAMAMVVVRSGRLRVLAPGPGAPGDHGTLGAPEEHTLTVLGPGESLGLRECDRGFELRAVEDCELLMFGADELPDLGTSRAVNVGELLPSRCAAMDPTGGYGGAAEISDAPPSAPAPTRRSPEGAARLRRFPFVRQMDQTDCGVACLAMICRHYGAKIPLSEIRHRSGAGVDGTSLTGLCRAAQTLGFEARSMCLSAASLARTSLPLVAHWQNNHWIVVVEVRPDRVRIVDPRSGEAWVRREEFEAQWSGYAAVLAPGPRFGEATTATEQLGSVLRHFSPHRKTLVIAVLLALLVAGLSLLLPIFTQLVVDRVVVDGSARMLSAVVVSLGVVFAMVAGSRLLHGYLVALVAVRVDADFFDSLSSSLLALPMSYFHGRRTGDIQRRIAGAREVREMVVRSSVSIVLTLVQCLVAVTLMLVYSPKLTLVFAAVTPLYVALLWLSSRYLGPLFSKLEEQYGRHQSDQLEAISGIEDIKLACAEERFRSVLSERFTGIARQQFRADLGSIAYGSALQGVVNLSQILFLWVGANLAIDGELTIGGFVAFTALASLVNEPLVRSLSLWDSLKRGQTLVGRLMDIYEARPEQARRDDTPAEARPFQRIALRRVSFAYGAPGDKPALEDINLEIRAGEMVALVGRTGSGKTTLAKLLAGLLVPTEGSITFDGVSSEHLDPRRVRHQIGFVLQDSKVFSMSLLENIALGQEPDPRRARAAAKVADAHDFICALPLEYDTEIGEGGILLSGGQVQKIAIARAVYKRPSLFIFDEATSNLDSHSERTIHENLQTEFAGRTRVVIAHRLSTVRAADRILVFDRGSIVEQGSHEQLMRRRGLYHELVNAQLELGPDPRTRP